MCQVGQRAIKVHKQLRKVALLKWNNRTCCIVMAISTASSTLSHISAVYWYVQHPAHYATAVRLLLGVILNSLHYHIYWSTSQMCHSLATSKTCNIQDIMNYIYLCRNITCYFSGNSNNIHYLVSSVQSHICCCTCNITYIQHPYTLY
jgi:hypothetical protein